jgi:hypothetical protein
MRGGSDVGSHRQQGVGRRVHRRVVHQGRAGGRGPLPGARVRQPRPLPRLRSRPGGDAQTAQVFRQAFPDWNAGQQAHIAEGDLVAEQFTARGTHQGELLGVAPTGREVVLAGINIFRVQDGRVVERWGRTDDLGFLQQLGIVPALAS